MPNPNSTKYWLSVLPKNWQLKRLKDIAEVRSSNVDKKSSPEEEGVLLCNYTDVYYNHKITKDINFMEATAKREQIKKFQLKKGYIILTKDSEDFQDIAVSSLVKEDLKGVICGYHLALLKPKSKLVHSGYLNWLFNSSSFNYWISIQAKGITRVGLGINSLEDLEVPLPPLKVQEKAFNFLDEKIVDINLSISLLKEKINHYKDYLQSLINGTVLQGLNPEIRLIHSGIDWIGEIPENWGVQRLGTALEERSDKVSDKDYIPLSVTMNGIVPRLESAAKTKNGDNRKKVVKGDIVINSRSDRKGAAGLSDYTGSVSVISIVLKPRKIAHCKYFHYLIRCNAFSEEFFINGKGIVDDLWSTKYSAMKNIQIPLPPVLEQEGIAEFLEQKTKLINEILANLYKQIELLSEYRKSLINEIVTGQRQLPT
jgi:type I restriction enzyme S subunit